MSTKRRSWKKDYLALEKKHAKLQENYDNALKANKTVVEKLEAASQRKIDCERTLKLERKMLDAKREELDAFKRKFKGLKTKISEISKTNYFWIGGISRIKLELQELL